MHPKRLWLLALATVSCTNRVVAEPAVQWAPMPSAAPASNKQAPAWEPTPQYAKPTVTEPTWTVVTPTEVDSSAVVWEPLPSGSADLAKDTTPTPTDPTLETQQEAQQALKALAAQQPSGPTYANFRALWRDDEWLPQISNTVPIGFGPKGVMGSLTIEAVDCKTGPCTPVSSYKDWQKQFQAQGSGFFWQSIGFGDPQKWLGITITNSTEGFADTATSGNGISLSSGNQTGVHISRALGPDTSLRAGIENLIIWDTRAEYSDNRNAYAVISQRFRLNKDNQKPFSNLYITIGAGNGEFRSLEQLISAQIAAQRSAGCQTFGYVPKKDCSNETRFNAVKRAGDYGTWNFIGAAALQITEGLNIIAEWSGRNLNAGVSWRPIKGVGFVITPMIQSLLPNCEYGCNISVPDYPEPVPLPENVLTYRPRLSIMGSLEIKF
jgi:hypothetical protein